MVFCAWGKNKIFSQAFADFHIVTLIEFSKQEEGWALEEENNPRWKGPV